MEWLRVDKEDGRISVVQADVVRQAARMNFARPAHALASGRFATSWAVYTRREQMTEAEVAALAAQAKGGER